MTRREQLYQSAFPYVLSDIFAVVCAYYGMLVLRFHSEWGSRFFTWVNVTLGVRETAELGLQLQSFYHLHAPRILLLLSATLILLYAFLDLYVGRRFIRRRYQARNIILANLGALLLFFAYFYLTRNAFHPRSLFATLLALNSGCAVLFRSGMAWLLERSGLIRCPVVILGDGEEGRFIGQYIRVRRPRGLEVASVLPYDPEEPMAGVLSRVESQVRQQEARMIVCADPRMTVARIMQLLEKSEVLGQEVKVLSDRLAVLVNEGGMAADFFFERPLVHFAIPPHEKSLVLRTRLAVMRLLALSLLILLGPLLLAIALAIRLSGKGPVFFIQERIGFNRKPFRMYKFRTMHDRAEELQAQVEEFNESGEGLFKIRKDPRVTQVGRFLRRFSLDEMPQLLNVVRGEMTLVGPRPLPKRDFESYYEEWHYSRHSGLPGLTCLWQVSGRSDVSFHNMCILDDYYLRNQSAILDCKLLVRTVGVVVFARGAY